MSIETSLRDSCYCADCNGHQCQPCVAADEIERLRAENLAQQQHLDSYISRIATLTEALAPFTVMYHMYTDQRVCCDSTSQHLHEASCEAMNALQGSA